MKDKKQSNINWTIETRKIKDLKPHPKNPRQLSEHDAEHLERSLSKFGLIDKPIITAEGMIIGGHQRVAVLKKMGHKEVECFVPDTELAEPDIDELNIRLNRNSGSWDFDVLANEWDENDLLDFGFTEQEFAMGPIDEIDSEEEPKEKDKPKKTCPNCGHEL